MEYKTEAVRMVMELLELINAEIVSMVFKLFPAEQQIPLRGPRQPAQMRASHDATAGMGLQANRQPAPGASGGGGAAPERAGKPQPVQVGEKVGRNDPCPCGSGKKYKHCHGR